MEMLEPVARAICNSLEADNFDELHPGGIERAAYMQQAQAAIEAYQKVLWPPHFIDRGFKLEPELRRYRAQQLTAHVLHVIGKYLCEHGEGRVHEDASRALMTMFYESGADIITDLDRANAGLLPRGPYGVTVEELQIMEAKRTQAMLAPIPPFFVNGQGPK